MGHVRAPWTTIGGGTTLVAGNWEINDDILEDERLGEQPNSTPVFSGSLFFMSVETTPYR